MLHCHLRFNFSESEDYCVSVKAIGWVLENSKSKLGDCIIVGGESGPGYRPMDHAWARRILALCRQQGIAFFFKQSAAPRTEMGTKLDGREYKEYPFTLAPPARRDGHHSASRPWPL